MAECQILGVALDIVNTRQGTNVDMYQFWQIVYMTSLFMCVCVIPFCYFFYETDEDMDYVSILIFIFSFIFPAFRNRAFARRFEI